LSRIALLSTSDTDLLSTRASGADYRWVNPAKVAPDQLVEIATACDLVGMRILGSPASIRSELAAVRAAGRPVVVLGGEQPPDASACDCQCELVPLV
jgi:cobaltochelatase CobN